MTASYHLHRLVHWRGVYNDLLGHDGVDVNQPLPCRVVCPLCRGALGVHQDTIHQGQWLSCADCLASGDPILFAARCWGVPAAAAARRLLPSASDEDVERYDAVLARGYAAVGDFWERARAYLPAAPGLRGVRLHLGVSPTVQGDCWKSRGGKHLGGCTRAEAEALVGRRLPAPAGQPSDRDDLLVVPFHDLPGRISSILLVRRTGREGGDYYYYPLLPLHARPARRAVPGVFGLEALHMPRDFGGDSALVILDPLLAARLMVRHWSEEATFLPASAAWPDAPPCPSVLETGRKVVVWGHRADVNLFRHAAALDAQVAVCSARLEDIRRQVQRCRPSEWVSRQVSASRPWREALETRLASLPAAEAESLLAQLEVTGQTLREFLEGCRPSVRSALGDFYRARCAARHVVVGGVGVNEANDCWWLRDRHSPLADAVVRVEKVVHLASSGRTFCRGVVRYRGGEVPFSAQKHELEKGGWSWLADFLIREGLGVLEGGRRPGAPSLFEVAVAFRRPEVSRASERAGWDEGVPGFSFPGFTVRVGGSVEDNWAPWADGSSGPVPAAGLERPRGLDTRDLQLLSSGPGARLAWSVALTVLHNLLADAWGYPTRGLAVAGSAREAVGRAAEGLGCPRLVPTPGVSPWSARGPMAGWAHGFPLVLDGPVGPAESWSRWLAGGRRNHVALLGSEEARLCTVYGGWLRLDSDRPLETTRATAEALGRVVPNYLKDLADRRLQTRSTSTEPLDRVAGDVAEWFARQGGEEAAVRAGDRSLTRDAPGDAALAFADVLYGLLEAGKLRFDRAGFSSRPRAGSAPAAVYFEDSGGVVWVPQAGVQDVLRRRRLPPLDIARVGEGLSAAGALAGVREHLGRPGWLIRESWWDERVRACRARGKEMP